MFDQKRNNIKIYNTTDTKNLTKSQRELSNQTNQSNQTLTGVKRNISRVSSFGDFQSDQKIEFKKESNEVYISDEKKRKRIWYFTLITGGILTFLTVVGIIVGLVLVRGKDWLKNEVI